MWGYNEIWCKNLRYTENNDGETVAVIGYHSLNSELVIPSCIEYSGKRYRVVRIERKTYGSKRVLKRLKNHKTL
ncbi:MAG: hypothetical protein ACI30M_03380, partial [Muribaculaceae bacterium]